MKYCRHWGKSILLTTVVALFCFNLSYAQSPALNISIVNVDDSFFPQVKAYISVSDAQGFPITGVDTASFQLSEDNQPVNDFTITPYRNEEQPLGIVLAIDTSGSMNGKPLNDSITAAKNFLSALTTNDQLAIVSFSSKVITHETLTKTHADINVVLDGLTASGNTAMYDSIIESTNLLKNFPERKVIILLTDGKDTGISQFDFDQVVNEAVRWSTPIFPIGFGSVDQGELTRLAKLTGGFAQINPDSTTLTDSFQNILDNLREQYLIEFISSNKSDGLEHDLNLTLDYQGASSSVSHIFIAGPTSLILTLSDIQADSTISGNILLNPKVNSPVAVAQLDILLDNQQLISISSSPFEYTWDSGLVPSGNHILELIATDIAGNTGSLVLPINTIPAIQITPRFIADQVFSGNSVLSTEVEAPAGVAKVEFLQDNQPLGETTNPPYENKWNSSNVSPGYHDITIKVTDNNGYVSEVTTQVNVDIQSSSNLIWMSAIVVIAAAAIIIPLALKRNRSKRNKDIKTKGTFVKGQAQNKAVLIENEGINPGKTWVLSENDIRLGRKRDDNEIVLMGLKASRNHAIIRHEPEGFVLYTLRVENPVIVNGVPSDDQILLKHGDVIEAGESKFVFEVLG